MPVSKARSDEGKLGLGRRAADHCYDLQSA